MKKINNINNTQNAFEDAPKGEFKSKTLNIVFDPDADGYLSLALYQKAYKGATNVLIMERGEQVVVPDGIDAVFLDCHHSDGDAQVIDHHAPYMHDRCTAVQVSDVTGHGRRLAYLVEVRDLMLTADQVGKQLHLEGMALSHYLFNSKDKIKSASVGSALWWGYMINKDARELEEFIERIVPAYKAHLRDVDNYAERMVIEGESFSHPLIEGKGLLVEDSPLMFEAKDNILEVTGYDYLVMRREIPAGTLHICRSTGDCDLRPCAEAHGSGGHKNAASFLIKGEN